MLVHLRWKHGKLLSPRLHEVFDGGLEKIKEQIKKQLNELEKNPV